MQIIRSSIKILIYFVFFVYASLMFYFNYPIVSFFEKLFAIGIAGLIALAALLIGRQVVAWLRLRTNSELEIHIYSLGLGLGILSLLVFLCGIAGLLNPVLLYGIVLLIIVSYRKEIKALCIKLRKISIPRFSFWQGTMVFFIMVSLLLSFIASLAPPTYYDSLVYHCALPAVYLREGIIRSQPYNLFSYFPANMEMLYTLSLGMGSDLAANLISWITMVVTLGALYVFAKRIFSLSFTLFGCLLFITSPSVLLLGSGTYVDSGLAMYTCLCIISFYAWWEKEDQGNLVLAALCAGFAFGTKYTGAICPLILLSMVFFKKYMIKSQNIKPLKNAFLFAAIWTAVSLPWLIKNMVAVGNPVFPFFYNVFGWGDILWTQESAFGYFTNFVEYGVKKNVLSDIIGMLFNTDRSLLAFGGGFDVLGNFGWTLSFLLLPTIFFSSLKKKHVIFFCYYGIVHIVIWALTGQVLRFLLPIFPVIIIISITGVESFMKKFHAYIMIVFSIVLGIFIVSNFYLFFTIESIIQPWSVAMGIEEKEDFLRRKFPDYYPAMQFINENLSSESKIYLFGDQRGYYCKKKYEATCVFAPERLLGWANHSDTPEHFIAQLKDNHFTHIFYNAREAERLKPYGVLNFTEKGQNIWNDAIHNFFQLVYHDKFSSIYQINTENKQKNTSTANQRTFFQ